MATVGSHPGESRVLIHVLHHLARAASHMRIVNGTPGASSLRIVVDGHRFEAAGLHPAEMRLLDVSSAMRAGSLKTLEVIAQAPGGSSATVVAAD